MTHRAERHGVDEAKRLGAPADATGTDERQRPGRGLEDDIADGIDTTVDGAAASAATGAGDGEGPRAGGEVRIDQDTLIIRPDVGTTDAGDRERPASARGQMPEGGEIDAIISGRITAAPGQSDTPVRRRRRTHGCVDIDAVDIKGQVGAGVAVEEDVPGRGDRIVDVNVAALDGDWPLDVQGRLEQDAGGVGRAAEGQAGQGVGQDEPIG